jgi:peptidoglycan/LPS O-acetylase OafA/YrhL
LDIQGLRALAVLAVIVDHLCGWPGGGFIGVDVFFVISGFLISGLLIRQHEKTGHISFFDFYRRRIKRIVPAAVLVIVATVVAGHGVLRSQQVGELRVDAFWALLFSANWRFGLQGTDYFNLDRAISPLQHYWSLSIEEQFYFVWPWVMLAIFTIFARRAARIALSAVMIVIVIGSFVYAIAATRSDADSAYFSSFTRAWELGVGALLALAVPQLQRIPDVVRPAMAWIGLGGILVGVWFISGDHGFPAPAAALPVLATALVIAAGTYRDPKQQQRKFAILTNVGARFVGDISYSLYLWHFPVIILFSTWYGPPDGVYYTLTVLMIAALSIASYYLVEQPLRYLPWGFSLPLKRQNYRSDFGRWAGGHDWKHARFSALALVATTTVVLAALVLTVQPIATSGDDDDVQQLPDTTLATPAAAQVAGVSEQTQQAAIVEALRSRTFPDLKPGIDKLTTQQWINELTRGVGCGNVSAANVRRCTFGPKDAPKTAVLIGDSYGMAWMPAARAALNPEYRITQLTLGQCPGWGVTMLRDKGDPFPECDAHLAWAIKTTKELAPDLVIDTQSDIGITRVKDHSHAIQTVTANFTRVLADLRTAASKVVVLSAPPGSPPLQSCVTRTSTPDDCDSRINAQWVKVAQAEKTAADTAGVDYVDTRNWFCSHDRCPGWVNDTPVRADGSHMTRAFAATLGPLLREALSH